MFKNYLTGSLSLALLAGMLTSTTSLADEKSILVQSTTSTQNSGLYDDLLPKFTADTGIKVNVVAVGTGQAIRNAMNGDGDVLLVHAKPAEEKFVKEGYGVKRYDLMYNDFIIVGPPSDPAGIKGMTSATDALKKIAETESLFASRGDNSGTNKKEIALWKETGVDPSAASGTWYRETGSGMGATLNAAVGMSAYTMTDRGTWISFKNKGDYEVVVEGDAELFNQYGIILVNPEKFPNVDAEPGRKFIDWMLSDKGQSAIASYKLDGQQLFFPNAGE